MTSPRLLFATMAVLLTHLTFGQLSFKNSYSVENDFVPMNLAAADFDGDAFKDLMYANSSERKIQIIYNPGSPNTSSSQTITLNSKFGTLLYTEAGDFNNDGKTDIFAVNYNYDNKLNNQFVILLSTGSSFSQQTIILPFSYYNWFPQVIDFDKDGALDILMGNTQSLYFYKGDGHGNFSVSTLDGMPINWVLFKPADVNLDGQNDFVFASMDTLFVYLKKTGAPGYSKKKYPYTSPVVPIYLAIGDLSGDGNPEIMASMFFLNNNSSTSLAEYVNDGNGGFGSPNIINYSGVDFCNIDLLDYDKDGQTDLLTGFSGYGQDVKLLKNMGNNQFSDQSPHSYYDAFSKSTIFADLDNNGLSEIIELSYFKYLNFFSQVGGFYQFSKKMVLATTAYLGRVADLNGDGNQDIMTTAPTGGEMSIFYGQGNNKFSEPKYFTSGNDEIRACTNADFNGDGYQDVVYATNIGSIKPVIAILFSDPAGTLGQPQIIDNTSSYVLATGDFNGDGKIDIASSQGIYLNDGSAHFTYKSFFTGVGYVARIQTGNFNADGYLDLVINDGGSNYISLNDGLGNFGTFSKVNSSRYFLLVKSVLMNTDNLSDLVALHANNDGFSIFINQGDGSFTEQTVNAPPNAGLFGYADVEDINLDGLKDVVAGVSSSVPQQLFGAAVFLQDQNGNFNFSQNVGFNQSASGTLSVPDFVQIADVDNDAKKDIVCFKLNGDPLEIILNDFVFEPTQSPQAISLTNLTNQSAAFSMQKGNGNGRLAIIREISSKKAAPIDGIFYTSNAKAGIGAQIGSANYVVLRADSSSLHVTGLKEATLYSLIVYEYATNSANTIINYLTSSADSLHFTTKKSQTIVIPTVVDKTVNDSPFPLGASSSSGLAVSYSVSMGTISLSGDSVRILAPGPVKILVNQEGDDSFGPADTKEIDFCINPLVPIITITNTTPGKYSLTSSSSSNNQWLLNDQPLPDATQTSLDPTDNGIYSVRVDFSGCHATSTPTPYLITSLENIASDLQIFPNPFSMVATIQVPEGEYVQEILMSDIMGRYNPISFLQMDEKTTINMTEFRTGVYFFKILTPRKSYVTRGVKID